MPDGQRKGEGEMTPMRPWRYLVLGLMAVLALGLPACGAEEEASGEGDVKTDIGVTSEPCPGSPNKDRGCIYLGTLSDLTEGPFAPLAVPITDAQKAFWQRANANGGIGGKYDVDVEKYTRDNKYNPEEHVAKLREIEPEVLALAQSLGTPPTLAGLEIQKQGELLAAPASWWSGWGVDDEGLILESGQSYCAESMNGLDWAAEEFGKPTKVLAVGYPGDYGGDSAAGVKVWAEANGATAQTVETAPNATAGNQDAAVAAIAKAKPDVVIVATGPAEMAEIVGKAVAGGYDGQFIGSVPSWNPAILKSEAAPAVEAKYHYVAPWGPYGSDSAAHKAMEEATGGKPPANDGYTFGWIWSYPVQAVLEKALANGDLTRAGVHEAVDQVTVDYEGALPSRKYGGEPNETAVREAVIVKPNPKAPLGASVLKDLFVGPTAEGHDFTEACSTSS
jgi:ABC-type branched-subunit amino acid transport system substrate-binding protein